jgi:DNA-binding LacI/PurR family transcriptional regulator/DNA-binding transcriptional regulator YhcF (GntR family)
MNSSQREIYERLVDRISDGSLKPGAKLPTEMELGVQFNTNRLNAHYAVKSLEEAGLVTRNKRGGTVIRSAPSRFTVGKLKSVTASRVCVLNQHHPAVSGIHWNQRLMGPLEQRLREGGLELAYRNIHGLSSEAEYKKLLESLVLEGCKALALIADGSGQSVAFERPELLSEFHERVFVFDPGQAVWQGFPYNSVSINLFGEGALAAERLIRRHGLKRLAMIKSRGLARPWFEQRLRGAACAMKRLLGEGHAPELLEMDSPDASFVKALAAEPERGAIAANDMAAAQLALAAKAAGVKLGEGGLKLISFDDNALYREFELTTVAPSLERIGEKLASLILGSAEEPGELSCVKINSTLTVRRTA